ncbi:PIG-L family deacetylase [Candidatus Woesearchaeota archaeon]|nr:PIG-L family deacetylase [Candidatus Woesearchaeota archaeon]MCF7901535.1 PIG-L family deacetylase [Candidatus Woesearchaeota archaeon]MCF8013879.1 PIG-L family deacetylase [Candidatus Woesearchaeota archaeon]
MEEYITKEITNQTNKKEKNKKNILIICAHSDDQILGAGGAIAKYSKEGYNIFTVIFSYGEFSHFHMKKEHVKEMRVKESLAAENAVGGKGIILFDHRDGKVKEDVTKKKTHLELKKIIDKFKPEKIFTHSQDDLHPDHRAVLKTVLKSYDLLDKNSKSKPEIYCFEVSQLWNIKKRKLPILVVDITQEFKNKIKALHQFKSQINLFSHTYEVNLLYIGVYIRAFISGILFRKKLAEIFYKIR